MAAKPDSDPRPQIDDEDDSWRRGAAAEERAVKGRPDAAEAPRDPKPLAPATPVPPARTEPVVISRWVQAVALPLALLALYALARAAKDVVLIFLIAGVIALIVNPLVSLVKRTRIPRGLAVFVVYLVFFAVIVGIVALLISPVTSQVEHFQRDVPSITKNATHTLGDVQRWLNDHHIGVKLQRQGETALQTIQRNVLKGSGSIVKFTSGVVESLAKAAFDLILILVVSVYMLLYHDRIGRVVRSLMPPGDGTPEDDFPLRVQKAVFNYVRGQLFFSLLMGGSAGLGLWILGLVGVFPAGKSYALFFGGFYALMELIPYLGPVLGAIPPVLVALFQQPISAVWLVLFFLALQQLEGHVVSPQVFGRTLRINPLLIIATLLVGSALYGVIGALVALPIAAVLRETGLYLREHSVLEPWGTPAAHMIGRMRGSPGAGDEPHGASLDEAGGTPREDDGEGEGEPMRAGPLRRDGGADGEPASEAEELSSVSARPDE